VEWIGAKYNNHVKGDVYIDGTFKTTVDTYSSSYTQPAVMYSITGLSSGSHTIKIVLDSSKDSSSSNYYLDVDAFEYYN
jgi:subtilase family serine protease